MKRKYPLTHLFGTVSAILASTASTSLLTAVPSFSQVSNPSTTPLASKAVDLSVARVGGFWVKEQEEDRQGSIVKTFDPFYEPPTKEEEEDGYPTDPNQKIRLRLVWDSTLLGSVTTASLEESSFYPQPDKKGLLRIYDGDKIIKDYSSKSVSLINPIDDTRNHLPRWNGRRELTIEARRTGTVLLTFKLGSQVDTVRITSVPSAPRKGRILFVRAGAKNHNNSNPLLRFDDYDSNASASLKRAIEAAPNDSNVVVGPGLYKEHNITISKSFLLAGMGGNHDGKVETTNFNLDYAPVVDAQKLGPIFLLRNSSAAGTLTISSIIMKGRNDDKAAGNIEYAYGGFMGARTDN